MLHQCASITIYFRKLLFLPSTSDPDVAIIFVCTTSSRCEQHGSSQVDGHLAERQRRQLPRRHGQRPDEQRGGGSGGADGPVSCRDAAAAAREGRQPGLHAADAASPRPAGQRRRWRASPLHHLACDADPAAAAAAAQRRRRRRRQHLVVLVGVRSAAERRRLQRFLWGGLHLVRCMHARKRRGGKAYSIAALFLRRMHDVRKATKGRLVAL